MINDNLHKKPVALDRVKHRAARLDTGLRDLPEDGRGRYNTLAGMVMLLLGRLPRTTDMVEWQGWRFEVVDLDGKRVDKVLVERIPYPTEGSSP